MSDVSSSPIASNSDNEKLKKKINEVVDSSDYKRYLKIIQETDPNISVDRGLTVLVVAAAMYINAEATAKRSHLKRDARLKQQTEVSRLKRQLYELKPILLDLIDRTSNPHPYLTIDAQLNAQKHTLLERTLPLMSPPVPRSTQRSSESMNGFAMNKCRTTNIIGDVHEHHRNHAGSPEPACSPRQPGQRRKSLLQENCSLHRAASST